MAVHGGFVQIAMVLGMLPWSVDKIKHQQIISTLDTPKLGA